MSDSVRARGDSVATFRFVCIDLMETLGHWVPSTPELEVKLVFGRHIWDLAQHADQLGYRTHELRLALHASREPGPEYLKALRAVRALTDTGERIDALYDVVLPSLARHYEAYLENTDRMLDEPSVRILERLLWDLDRLWSDRDELRARRPGLPRAPEERLTELRGMFDGADMIVFRPDPAVAAEAS